MQGVMTRPERNLGEAWTGVGFALLGIVLGLLLIAAGNRVYLIQGSVTTIASLLPLGYAFGAGMVATANPCGILLLPSLVAYYLSGGEAHTLTFGQRVEKALTLGAMATLGFVGLFGIVGLVIGAGGVALARAFPVGGLVVGVALAGLGLWLALSGRGAGLLAASQAGGRGKLGDDPRSLFLFGVSYALCSLSCTLPIFLVVIGSALAAGSILTATTQFVSYALGMGVTLTLVILGTAFFQGMVTRSVRAVVPYVSRLAASFLLGTGIYVTHYWLAAVGLLR